MNTNRFYLEGTNRRFLHLASVSAGVKEYMCFIDNLTQKTYIEEISGGHLEFIEDDFLAFELSKFLEEEGVLQINKPALPDEWLKIGKKKS